MKHPGFTAIDAGMDGVPDSGGAADCGEGSRLNTKTSINVQKCGKPILHGFRPLETQAHPAALKAARPSAIAIVALFGAA